LRNLTAYKIFSKTTFHNYLKSNIKKEPERPVIDLNWKSSRIEENIRKRRVGVTGINFRPIDNKFQIREAYGKCVIQ